MLYIEAPVFSAPSGPTIFLAGGITDCPDWQAAARAHFERQFEDDDWTLANPRRANFDVTDPEAAPKQIRWEHHWLEFSDVVLFWFPKETLCPITLYELGVYTMSDKRLVVGCDPGYKRLLDVQIQTRYRRPEVEVVSDWDDFIEVSLDMLDEVIHE